jgi:hypothetical protein
MVLRLDFSSSSKRVTVKKLSCRMSFYGGGSIHGQNPDFKASDPAEMGYVPRADQNSESQTACSRCDGDVILRNHHSALGQLDKDVGMMFRSFRSERLDPHHAAQGLEAPHPAGGGIG